MRILIADDESIIRRGIEKVVLEMALFDEVVTAKNGKEALELCQTIRFDVMLVDIMMPVMGGLEFLRALKESKAEQRTGEQAHAIKIIISGYDEFDYAKQAIELGVEEFLLKPLSPEDIKGLTAKVYSEAKSRNEKVEKMRDVQKKAEESLPLLRDKFFYDLSNSDIKEEKLRATAELLEMKIDYEAFQVAFIGVSQTAVDSPMDTQVAVNLAEEILCEGDMLSEQVYRFRHGTGQLALLFCFDECRKKEDTKVGDFLLQLAKRVKEKSGLTVCCGTGTVVFEVSDICHSAAEARSAMRYAAEVKRENVQNMADIRSTGILNVTLESLYELCDMLRYCRRRAARDWLQMRLDMICHNGGRVTSEEIDGLICGVGLAVLDAIRASGMEREAAPFYAYSRMIPEISGANKEKLSQKLTSYVEQAMDVIESEEQSKNRRFVDQAMAYAEEHYHENITTQSVAEELSLSRNYFGQLFKKETGTIFSEYLSKLRIQKAKKLLRGTNMKIYQISEEVGIEDSFYFSALFKKFAGLAPSEYREQA